MVRPCQVCIVKQVWTFLDSHESDVVNQFTTPGVHFSSSPTDGAAGLEADQESIDGADWKKETQLALIFLTAEASGLDLFVGQATTAKVAPVWGIHLQGRQQLAEGFVPA